jgi:hypothetical protein
MQRAAYHARKRGSTGGAPDTSALRRRLEAAVAALSDRPGPQSNRIAGKIGALIDGQGADGIFFTAQVDGGAALMWGAAMDQALRAVAGGRLDDAEGMLDALARDNRLARRPGEHLINALRELAADLEILASFHVAKPSAGQVSPLDGNTGTNGKAGS